MNPRAALAAARVAARYAKAPTFSQLQAAETLRAHRPSHLSFPEPEAELQQRAEAVLDRGIEPAGEPLPAPVATPVSAARPEPAPVADAEVPPAPVESMEAPQSRLAEPALRTELPFAPAELPFAPAELPFAPAELSFASAERQPSCEAPRSSMAVSRSSSIEAAAIPLAPPPVGVRWAEDMPVRRSNSALAVDRRMEEFAAVPEPVREPAAEPEEIEPDQPIHANLIEFPRELVASRKARPRLAEGPFATAPDPAGQLSIFEVDPSTISTQPDRAPTATKAEPYEWASIKLDAQPEEEIELEPEPELAAPVMHVASFSRRLMAGLVDSTLILGAFLLAAWGALSKMEHLSSLKPLEAGAAVALVGVAIVYQMVFSALSDATPGMRYAGIALCTFDDQIPTRAQRCNRFGALLLSMLPVGLGLAWAVFDEERLCWHDRLSKTYQRKR